MSDLDALWDYNQPAASEARFRHALAAIPADSSAYVEILTQIARTQGLQHHFEAAHQMLDEAKHLLQVDWHRAHIRYLLERGRIFNSANKQDQARPFFQQAWELAQSTGDDFYAVDAAHMLAIVASSQEQLAWNLKALNLAEHSSDLRTHRWLGSLYNNIGWAHHDMRQYEEALAVFQKALVWRTAANQPVETRIAKWCVARVLRSLARLEEALVLQRQLVEEWAVDGGGDGYVFEEVGECLLAMNRADEAAPYFARAYEMLRQDLWLVENEQVRLERLKTLGSDMAFSPNK